MKTAYLKHLAFTFTGYALDLALTANSLIAFWQAATWHLAAVSNDHISLCAIEERPILRCRYKPCLLAAYMPTTSVFT